MVIKRAAASHCRSQCGQGVSPCTIFCMLQTFFSHVSPPCMPASSSGRSSLRDRITVKPRFPQQHKPLPATLDHSPDLTAAVQAIFPFVTEALRCDILRTALASISQEVITQVRAALAHAVRLLPALSCSRLCQAIVQPSWCCVTLHAVRGAHNAAGRSCLVLLSAVTHGACQADRGHAARVQCLAVKCWAAHGSVRFPISTGRRCPSSWMRARCWVCRVYAGR
jgi:hypothetical protein